MNDDKDDSVILKAALKYLGMGYSVIPVKRETKRPLIDTWKEFQSVRPTEEQIRGWWAWWPEANVAIITGSISGIVVVDLDRDLSPMELLEWQSKFSVGETFTVKTQRGWHVYFKHPGFDVRNRAKIDGYIDARQDGGYVVAPPSIHESGFQYKIGLDYPLADMPKPLIKFLMDARVDVGKVLASQEVFEEGGRRVAMMSLAGKYLKRGWSAEEVFDALLGVNLRKCNPPLKAEQIKDVVEDIYKAETRQISGKVSKLEEVKAVFDKWLYIVDPYWIEITLATIVANRWKIDPLWMVILAPSSTGKTEIINSVSELADTYALSSLTPQTFISGMKDKEMSLIYKLNGKTLLLKDLTTVLNMRSDDKAAIFSQLREIADGKLSKAFGAVQTKFWEGKMGLMACCTGVLENQMLYNNQMGERMLVYKPVIGDMEAAGMKSLQSFGHEPKMRAEFKEAMASFLKDMPRRPVEEIIISDENMKRIIDLGFIISTLRCGVSRDQFRRSVNYRPAPEGVGRMIKQFAMVAKAICEVRGSAAVGEYEMQVVEKVAWSNVHGLRMDIVDFLIKSGAHKSTQNIAEAIRMPGKTALEYLEDMLVLGFLDRDNKTVEFNGEMDGGPGRKPYQWWIQPKWLGSLAKTSTYRDCLKDLDKVQESTNIKELTL